jgi:hypothetical protein
MLNVSGGRILGGSAKTIAKVWTRGTTYALGGTSITIRVGYRDRGIGLRLTVDIRGILGIYTNFKLKLVTVLMFLSVRPNRTCRR